MNQHIFVLACMLLAHLIADYNLQGWLAQAKQKKWWEQNAPDKKYKHDWIAALICHSLMWAILITLPIMCVMRFEIDWLWLSIPTNAALHFAIDDLKANKYKINLAADQLLHLCQIIITWGIYLIINL